MNNDVPRGRARRVVEVFLVFLRLGVTSFGGPAAHLGYFRDELVAKRRWVTEQQYAELVALCQFLPGPASSQVGFALGLTRAGYRGAIAAWCAFTLPSAILLVLFAYGAVALDGPIGQGLLTGLKAVAVAVVAHAVWGMARTLTPDLRRIVLAAIAAALALLVPGSLGQIAAIIVGITVGVFVCRAVAPEAAALIGARVSRTAGIAAFTVFVMLLAGLPLVAFLTRNFWVGIADAFYRPGALVFGGGHVVLPLLQAEPAIAGTVSPDQFLAGYGAAQAVPGPLFTFAAYLGSEMQSGVSGLLAASLALVAVFLPGILLLIAALPYWNALRKRPLVRSAVTGANAAVVGILAAALYHPVMTSAFTGLIPVIIAIGCFLLLTVWKLPAWVTVLAGAASGVIVAVFDIAV